MRSTMIGRAAARPPRESDVASSAPTPLGNCCAAPQLCWRKEKDSGGGGSCALLCCCCSAFLHTAAPRSSVRAARRQLLASPSAADLPKRNLDGRRIVAPPHNSLIRSRGSHPLEIPLPLEARLLPVVVRRPYVHRLQQRARHNTRSTRPTSPATSRLAPCSDNSPHRRHRRRTATTGFSSLVFDYLRHPVPT